MGGKIMDGFLPLLSLGVTGGMSPKAIDTRGHLPLPPFPALLSFW